MRRRRIRKLWPFVLLVIIALIDIYLLIEEKKSNDSALSTLIANVVYFNRPNQGTLPFGFNKYVSHISQHNIYNKCTTNTTYRNETKECLWNSWRAK